MGRKRTLKAPCAGEGIVHLLGEEEVPPEFEDVENELTAARVSVFERIVNQLEGRLHERKVRCPSRGVMVRTPRPTDTLPEQLLIANLVSEIRVKLIELKEGTRSPLEKQVMGSLVPPDDNEPRLRSITPSEDCVGVSGVYVTQLTALNGRLDEEKRERQLHLQDLGELLSNAFQPDLPVGRRLTCSSFVLLCPERRGDQATLGPTCDSAGVPGELQRLCRCARHGHDQERRSGAPEAREDAA
eukprot:scaffold2862_cov272-Pinguiococcus_pyrenoidosus.AAC.11